jgi:hypothetical protein
MSFLLLLMSTLHVLPGSEAGGGEREGAGGMRQGEEMAQTMYAHMNY